MARLSKERLERYRKLADKDLWETSNDDFRASIRGRRRKELS